MTIQEKLMADLKDAMKQKLSLKKSVITMLRAAIKQVEVDERRSLEDDEILDIIAKQVKQKRSVIEEFIKGDRQDLADEAQEEILVLEGYLPEPLSEEELRILVKDAIETSQATSMKDMGKVMTIVTGQSKGRADGKVVSQMVKDLLK
jgi:uncharacterized protein YqeY